MRAKNLFLTLTLIVMSLAPSSAREYKPFIKYSELQKTGDQATKVKLGAYKENYPNGKPKVETQFDEKLQAGTGYLYFQNGLIKEEVNYRDGKLDGLQKKYRENGVLSQVLNYKDDQLDGEQLYFHRNGNLKKKVSYATDSKNGLEKKYDKQGILKSFKQYQNGKRVKSKYGGISAKGVAAIGAVTAGTVGLALLQGSLNSQRCVNGRLVRVGNRCYCERNSLSPASRNITNTQNQKNKKKSKKKKKKKKNKANLNKKKRPGKRYKFNQTGKARLKKNSRGFKKRNKVRKTQSFRRKRR